MQVRDAQQAAGQPLATALLYTGCRHREHDSIYAEELEGHVASGALSRLSAAFSRDSSQKVYVQHHLERDAGARPEPHAVSGQEPISIWSSNWGSQSAISADGDREWPHTMSCVP